MVAEIEEPFLPLPDDLIVNLVESRAVVEALLDALPSMFAANLTVRTLNPISSVKTSLTPTSLDTHSARALPPPTRCRGRDAVAWANGPFHSDAWYVHGIGVWSMPPCLLSHAVCTAELASS